MHSIWNPWHGCIKKSEGCQNCYMYFLDSKRDKDGSKIFKVKNNFYYPLLKNKDGSFKIKSGEMINVCLTSDFFLEKADEWREEVWNIMKKRCDVAFFLLTKRPERILNCLPKCWFDGFENIFLSITAENQVRADERIPILLDLPFKHKGIVVAPFIGPVSIEKYLKYGVIERVVCGGENYDGSRILNYDWVLNLHSECLKNNITFCFMETGTHFLKNKKLYNIPSKYIQSQMAFKTNLNFLGKDIIFKLKSYGEDNLFEKSIFGVEVYKRYFKERCNTCGSKIVCNGCSNCKKCEK